MSSKGLIKLQEETVRSKSSKSLRRAQIQKALMTDSAESGRPASKPNLKRSKLSKSRKVLHEKPKLDQEQQRYATVGQLRTLENQESRRRSRPREDPLNKAQVIKISELSRNGREQYSLSPAYNDPQHKKRDSLSSYRSAYSLTSKPPGYQATNENANPNTCASHIKHSSLSRSKAAD